MRVLVTGGSGFIGSHVADRLCQQGVTVRVFDLVAPTFRDDLEFHQGNILDLDGLCEGMTGVDSVVHLAAVADVKDVFQEPLYAEEVNVRGTVNVLEAMRRSKVRHIVYGSTVWAYSDCDEAEVDEDTPIHAPSHLYTVTKVASEFYCRAYSQLYGTEYTVLRFGIPYGPRSRDGAVVPIFVEKALSGKPLTIAGDGSQFRKFVYVEDLAEGVALALKPVARNRMYNLDGEEKVTIRQIAEVIKAIIGDVSIEYVESRPGDFSGIEVSSSRAREELGWEPRVDFEEGIRRYIAWYRRRQADQRKSQGQVNSVL